MEAQSGTHAKWPMNVRRGRRKREVRKRRPRLLIVALSGHRSRPIFGRWPLHTRLPKGKKAVQGSAVSQPCSHVTQTHTHSHPNRYGGASHTQSYPFGAQHRVTALRLWSLALSSSPSLPSLSTIHHRPWFDHTVSRELKQQSSSYDSYPSLIAKQATWWRLGRRTRDQRLLRVTTTSHLPPP